MNMQPKNPAPNNTSKQFRNSIAFDSLCIELQYAFVAASEELIAVNYLGLKHGSSNSSIGYHVPPLIFEQSSLLLRPSTYQEIIEERATVQLCGLSTCPNKLPSIPNKNKKYYRLNLNKKQISQEEDSYFCCKKCYQKSMKFELNLEDVAIQFKSHSLEKIKQAVQFIFSWYKGKIKIAQTPNSNEPDENNNTNQLNKMIKNLKIVEKNVAFNLHQTITNNPNKKRWKRPIGHNKKQIDKNNNNKIQMEVDDDKDDKDDETDINMTKMEELFRIQKEEKLRMKPAANTNNNSGQNINNQRYQSKDENGRKIKINEDLSTERLGQIENEKARTFQDERHRKLYNSLSGRAQIMGYYISWCTDATTFFIMDDKNGYLNWKNKTINEYNDVYNDQILKQRQQLLINNVIKYVMGLLNKFNVNPMLISMVCNDIHLLIHTFDISEAIPTFTSKTWCFIAFVFLKLISHKISQLNKEMFEKKDKVQNVLNTIGFGEEYVTTLEGIVVLDSV